MYMDGPVAMETTNCLQIGKAGFTIFYLHLATPHLNISKVSGPYQSIEATGEAIFGAAGQKCAGLKQALIMSTSNTLRGQRLVTRPREPSVTLSKNKSTTSRARSHSQARSTTS